MTLAADANRYIDLKAPWRTAREDMVRTATTLNTALTAIAALKTALYPFMPHASERLHTLMGFSAPLVDSGWSVTPPPAGQALPTPTPLFTKLDEGTVERETAMLEAQTAR